jgi:hypothetical protein
LGVINLFKHLVSLPFGSKKKEWEND